MFYICYLLFIIFVWNIFFSSNLFSKHLMASKMCILKCQLNYDFFFLVVVVVVFCSLFQTHCLNQCTFAPSCLLNLTSQRELSIIFITYILRKKKNLCFLLIFAKHFIDMCISNVNLITDWFCSLFQTHCLNQCTFAPSCLLNLTSQRELSFIFITYIFRKKKKNNVCFLLNFAKQFIDKCHLNYGLFVCSLFQTRCLNQRTFSPGCLLNLTAQRELSIIFIT